MSPLSLPISAQGCKPQASLTADYFELPLPQAPLTLTSLTWHPQSLLQQCCSSSPSPPAASVPPGHLTFPFTTAPYWGQGSGSLRLGLPCSLSLREQIPHCVNVFTSSDVNVLHIFVQLRFTRSACASYTFLAFLYKFKRVIHMNKLTNDQEVIR